MLAERAFLHMGGAFGEHALPLVCWVGRGVNTPYLICGALGEHALPLDRRVARSANRPYQHRSAGW